VKIESKRTRDRVARRGEKSVRETQERLDDEEQHQIDEDFYRIADIVSEQAIDDDWDSWVKHFRNEDETQSLEERRTEL
jgi:hypothetical protein